LFYPVVVTNSSTLPSDPCAGAVVGGKAQNGTGATLEQCQRTGVTQAQFGTIHDCPAGQCNQALGGNTALKPETSDTVSLGFVFTPTLLRSFNLTVDYYNINLMGAISTVPINVTMSQCLASGDPIYCNQIHRNAFGQVWGDLNLVTGGYISGTNANIGF